MKKTIVWLLLIAFLMPVAVSQVFAAEQRRRPGSRMPGTKTCPISGDPVFREEICRLQRKALRFVLPGFVKDLS